MLSRQLRAALGDTAQALRDLSVGLSKVGDVERESGRLDAAAIAYRESLELGRKLRSIHGITPASTAALVQALDRVIALKPAGVSIGELIAERDALTGNSALTNAT